MSKNTFLYGFLSGVIGLFVLTVDIGRAFAYVKQQVITPEYNQKLSVKDIWRPYNGRRESPIARIKTMLKIQSSDLMATGYVEKALVNHRGRQFVSGSACVKGGKGTPRVQLMSRDRTGQDHSIGVFEAKVDGSKSAACGGAVYVHFSIQAEASWKVYAGQSLFVFLVFSDGERFQHYLLRNSGDLVLNLNETNRRPSSVAVENSLPRLVASYEKPSGKSKKKAKKPRMVAMQNLDEESISTGKGQKLSLKGLSKVEKRAIKKFLKDDPNVQFLDISGK